MAITHIGRMRMRVERVHFQIVAALWGEPKGDVGSLRIQHYNRLLDEFLKGS